MKKQMFVLSTSLAYPVNKVKAISTVVKSNGNRSCMEWYRSEQSVLRDVHIKLILTLSTPSGTNS